MMGIAGLSKSGEGRTNGGYSKLKRIILVCAFIAVGAVAAGIAGGLASPAAAQEAGPNGTAQATAPQEAQHLCVFEFDVGLLRYVTSPDQCYASFEEPLDLTVDDPINACASEGGLVRRVSGPGQRYSGETSFTLPGEEEMRFCAFEGFAWLRYVTDTNQCVSDVEIVVVVPPANDPP